MPATSPAAKVTGARIVAIIVNATAAGGPLAAASLCALHSKGNAQLRPRAILH